MKITIIAVGKLKENYLKKAVDEYSKDIKKRCALQIIELPDEKTKEKMSTVECEKIKDVEGDKILQKIGEQSFVIALAIEGKQQTSKQFENMLCQQLQFGKDIIFIIGGSLGIAKKVMVKANMKISFSDMTFPHQLMRVILLEQISKSL